MYIISFRFLAFEYTKIEENPNDEAFSFIKV